MPKSRIADLRALATARDFKVECAMTDGDSWQLIDQQGRKVTNPNTREVEFNAKDGVRFLKSLPGVARCPVWQRF
jgi:hypothetical protein